MHRLLRLIGYFAVFWTSVKSTTFTDEVQTSAGPIRGEELTFEDTKYKAFKGIPYAAPPLGELRFKAPQAPLKWTKLQDATKYGQACPQSSREIPSTSEDCLTLSVFTQSLDRSDLRPVLVFIHPGNFAFGDSSDEYLGPEYLIGEDIVFVTFNYRLGPLGFLSTNTSEASGNWGLKDQVAALKWVQENIQNFGGDPNQVTIYGLSSGAACLFHKAILSTGSAINDWILRTADQSVTYSQNIARILGAPESDIQDPAKRLRFLRSADAIKMAQHTFDVTEDLDQPLITLLPFLPVVEAPGTEGAFLTEDPKTLIREGRFTKVPMMMGLTDLQGEQFLRVNALTMSNTTRAMNISVQAMRALEEDVCQVLPNPLRKAITSKNECSNVREEIRKVYFNGKPFESSSLGIIYLIGDAFLTADQQYAQRMHAWFASQETPIYNYYFTFDGKWNIFKAISLPGASSGDEIAYVFKLPEKNLPKMPPTSPEVVTKNRMVRYIGNFVKYGNPTPSETDLIPVKWEPATEEECTTMFIGKELKLEKEFLKSRMDFWDRMYKKYLRSTMFD